MSERALLFTTECEIGGKTGEGRGRYPGPGAMQKYAAVDGRNVEGAGSAMEAGSPRSQLPGRRGSLSLRKTNSTRRLTPRFCVESFGTRGRMSAKPAADRREASMPPTSLR